MPREETLVRIHSSDDHWVGIVLSAAAGLGAGVVAGLIVGEWLGDVHGDRVRRALRRLRAPAPLPAADPETVELAVRAALQDHRATRDLELDVRALGDGLVELTGRAPDQAARRLAGEIAEQVEGADVIVNRILVDESGAPERRANPSNAG